jgi:hypothetical protein
MRDRRSKRCTVNRIALVSPTRSAQIEGILLRMAQGGQLRGRVNEETLINLLEQVSQPRLTSSVTSTPLTALNTGRRLSEEGRRGQERRDRRKCCRQLFSPPLMVNCQYQRRRDIDDDFDF